MRNLQRVAMQNFCLAGNEAVSSLVVPNVRMPGVSLPSHIVMCAHSSEHHHGYATI